MNISPNKIKPNITYNDFIPPKYERFYQSNIIIKYLTFFILGLDGLIFFGTIQQSFYKFDNGFQIVNFIFIIIIFVLDLAWVHYKLQHLVFGIYKIFMDLSIFQTNSKYYSGLEIPDSFIINQTFPNITIQMPVYKEDLENTIIPTIKSAIIQATRYELETGSICNIIVCDDGLNLISKEDKQKRILFYKENNIGYTARPHPSKYKRIGRFKKAGNLNFSINYSNIAIKITDKEEKNINKILNIDEIIENDSLIDLFYELIDLGAIFEGDICYGSYIFLIDSDTRFPELQNNGCLKILIKDIMLDGEDSVLYMQCFTAPYLSVKTLSEKCVFHFTCHIYNGIMVGTSMNNMAPLVGHNALLNLKLIDKIALVDPINNYKYYWSEDRISEDFDCMMRGCENGYIGRYISSAGMFLEGISFNYMTEYFKVSKFACGAAELTFNPVNKWFKKKGGFFSPDIIGFIMCKEIEWYNKISILAYILNFIAIAQSHFSMFYNLIFFEELFNVLPFFLLPVNLMWEGIIVWGGINTIVNLIFSRRMMFNTSKVLVQQIRELFFTSSLYGSLSVRFSMMYLCHLFNWNINFGATQKDNEKVFLMDWIKSTKYECIVYTFYLICICVRLFLFPIISYFHTFYFGCLPLFMSIFWYWFGPIFFDITSFSKDKTNTVTYDTESKMFQDKYGTQIPNSKLFVNSTNNSKTKNNENIVNDKKNKIYVNFGKIEEV